MTDRFDTEPDATPPASPAAGWGATVPQPLAPPTTPTPQAGAAPTPPYGVPPTAPPPAAAPWATTQAAGAGWGAPPPPPPTAGFATTPQDPQAAHHAARRHRRLLGVGVAASLVAVGLLAGAVGYAVGDRPPNQSITFPNGPFRLPTGPTGSGNNFSFPFPIFGRVPGGTSTSTTVPKAVQRSEAALVDVNTTIDEGQASGAGTGIVLTSDGIVLTNNHVVDGATTLSVTDLGNGQTYGATVLGYDVKDDVAVLKLTGASGLTTAKIGTPAKVGEAVYAVGNAGGTGGTPTVTSGTITGTDQSVTASDDFNGTSETLHGMLQTSAALISGDSGGALTTAKGAVVGVDTAGSSNQQSATGGFSIPIATALRIGGQITAGTASARVHVGETPLLGVEIRSTASTDGAQVTTVVGGTPAASVGITAGSRVTSVDGQTVTDGTSLRAILLTLQVGQKVSVTWVDAQGKTHHASVTLASGPPQ